MKRKPHERLALVLGGLVFGFCIVGCRYVLGLTDRTEALESDPDQPAPPGDAPSLTDGGSDAAPICRGPACIPRSCAVPDGGDSGARGTDYSCGADGTSFCCAVAEIEGGAFVANNACDAGNGCTDALTTISPYRLDVYEVTVGRFRKFVNDGYGTADNPPRANDGQHPKLEFSGWSAAWKEQLRPRKVDLSAALDGCAQGFGTWNQDSLVPVTCVTWYEAFAFCIYDGGRLPTEAEWSFAATGGSDQRLYPWGSLDPAVDAGAPAFASFCPAGITDGGGAPTIDGFNCTASPTAERVGTFSPQGDGRFGNADLAGNAFEYVFDWWSEPPPFPCKDCAVQTQGLTATDRVVRGGSWRASKGAMRNSARYHVSPGDRDSTKVPTIGFRCARDYP